MTKFLLIVSFFLLLGFGHGAIASYDFSVRVINNTGITLTGVSVRWRAKGKSERNCWGNRGMLSGDDHQHGCAIPASSQKWKRMIKVRFNCGSSTDGSREISFPRGKKWYARDHAQKNSDQYAITLKASDC